MPLLLLLRLPLLPGKGRQLLALQCSRHDLTSKPEAPFAGLLLTQASTRLLNEREGKG